MELRHLDRKGSQEFEKTVEMKQFFVAACSHTHIGLKPPALMRCAAK